MMIIHDFNIELVEYETKAKENAYPVFDRCPGCHCLSQGNLHRNGYYWRYGINEVDMAFHIPICRFRCLACKVNISILPSFLIPYFQHTVHTIVGRVFPFLEKRKVKGCRQQLAQHVKRLVERIHWVHSFFVDMGFPLGLSQDRKKEALPRMAKGGDHLSFRLTTP